MSWLLEPRIHKTVENRHEFWVLEVIPRTNRWARSLQISSFEISSRQYFRYILANSRPKKKWYLVKNHFFMAQIVRLLPNVNLPENKRNKNGAAWWCDWSFIRLRHLYVNFVLLEIQCSDSLRKVIKKIWNIIPTTRLKEPFCKLQSSTQYVSLHHMLKKIQLLLNTSIH